VDCGAGLPYIDSYKYLGQIINSDLCDIMILILCAKPDVYRLYS